MKVIAMPRGAGKTTELVIMSAKSGDYIVTRNHQSARNTIAIAKRLGLDIPFPLTFNELMLGQYYVPGIKGALIDDAETLLLRLLHTELPIHAMTFSTGESSWEKIMQVGESCEESIGENGQTTPSTDSTFASPEEVEELKHTLEQTSTALGDVLALIEEHGSRDLKAQASRIAQARDIFLDSKEWNK